MTLLEIVNRLEINHTKIREEIDDVDMSINSHRKITNLLNNLVYDVKNNITNATIMPNSYAKEDIDRAYCLGVLNTNSIDNVAKEINRLRTLKTSPSEILDIVMKK